LLLGLGDAAQLLQEEGRCVTHDEPISQSDAGKVRPQLLRLSFAHESCVDVESKNSFLWQGLRAQHERNGRIDPATDQEEHRPVANGLPDLFDQRRNTGTETSPLAYLAHRANEVPQDVLTVFGMHDLRM